MSLRRPNLTAACRAAAPPFPLRGLGLPKLALRGLPKLEALRGLAPKAAMLDVERTMGLRICFLGLPELALDLERTRPRAAIAPLRKLLRPGLASSSPSLLRGDFRGDAASPREADVVAMKLGVLAGDRRPNFAAAVAPANDVANILLLGNIHIYETD